MYETIMRKYIKRIISWHDYFDEYAYAYMCMTVALFPKTVPKTILSFRRKLILGRSAYQQNTEINNGG